ncbi:hypothetical protein AQI88_39785 [Streptomyces cellostaticus]|uniref:Multicopper oxidase CueO n=1 Tax=Streptomyces cellostaticus TaxID=67285 RepID=A0A117PSK0_9ACTN|nr:multicopper oxidase domain-containing protein [Streptomyces cellostaticus]KUM89332.1 hypothetical protein AQI88_39785 [Streptomyces cellostaticus]GHI04373.1 spore coat protein A [Streptomyces cellostaticus]
MTTRRLFLQLSGAVGGSALLPTGSGAAVPGPREVSAAVPPFQAEMPVPPVLRPARSTHGTDHYELVAKPGTAAVLPGLSTPVLGYQGSFIGPTIKATRRRRVAVTYRNGLTEETAVHLHGGHVAADQDGHPMDAVQPGEKRIYLYPNEQRGATLWYHDHAHHIDAEHVYRGLAGFYLLEDPVERMLPLPKGKYDIPVMIRNARFDTDGKMIFEWRDFFGRDTIIVNGKPQPHLRVEARKYRFRFLNAANLGVFKLSLSTGDSFVQIGSDGGLLPRPYVTPAFQLLPGERVEAVIDFSKYPRGTRVIVKNEYAFTPETADIMAFDVGDPAPDRSAVPDVLRPLPALGPADRTRQFVLGPDAEGMPVINGKSFDMDRVDTTIPLGSTEIWEITNNDVAQPIPIPHNMHVHLVQFRVLSRNGAPPDGGEAGLKDTVTVFPGETVRIQATFADYRGRYLYHCHFLDHAAEGMMAQLEVV